MLNLASGYMDTLICPTQILMVDFNECYSRNELKIRNFAYDNLCLTQSMIHATYHDISDIAIGIAIIFPIRCAQAGEWVPADSVEETHPGR